MDSKLILHAGFILMCDTEKSNRVVGFDTSVNKDTKKRGLYLKVSIFTGVIWCEEMMFVGFKFADEDVTFFA